jgi:AAA family ATP:ADP antiporter
VAQASAGDASSPEPAKKFMGYDAFTWSKIGALGAMFFCILFNYTILRDTKVGSPWQAARGGCMDSMA